MIIKNALIHDAINREPYCGDIVIENGKLVDLSGNGYVGTPRGGTNWVDGIKCPVVE